MYGTHKQLKMTSKVIGAETVGVLFTGLISNDPHQVLPERVQKKIKNLAEKLL